MLLGLFGSARYRRNFLLKSNRFSLPPYNFEPKLFRRIRKSLTTGLFLLSRIAAILLYVIIFPDFSIVNNCSVSHCSKRQMTISILLVIDEECFKMLLLVKAELKSAAAKFYFVKAVRSSGRPNLL